MAVEVSLSAGDGVGPTTGGGGGLGAKGNHFFADCMAGSVNKRSEAVAKKRTTAEYPCTTHKPATSDDLAKALTSDYS